VKPLAEAAFAAGCSGLAGDLRESARRRRHHVGFMGGTMKNPTYEDVCTDKTGHAETVLVVYDPEKVKYDQLLNIFWTNHDPTTPDRQGPDVGTQYRSVVFYYTPEQKAAAEASKESLQIPTASASPSSPRSCPPPISGAPRNITALPRQERAAELPVLG